jgi:protein SCO1/2
MLGRRALPAAPRAAGARAVMMALLAAAATAGCAAAPPAAATAPGPTVGQGGESIFRQPWTWSDDRGSTVTFSAWRGRTVVVGMVYTSCTTVCPMTIERLLRASDKLKREGRSAEFVLVTLDPIADTADALRRYRLARGLPAEWHLLRGSGEQTTDLAEFLRIRVIPDDDHVIHDGAIAVLDPDGRLLGHLRA